MSAGQVATSRSRRWAKSGSPRRGAPAQEDQVDPAKMFFFAGQASVTEVGVSPTERLVSDACQDGCRDGLRLERSPAVGPLSVAVRLGGSPAEL